MLVISTPPIKTKAPSAFLLKYTESNGRSSAGLGWVQGLLRWADPGEGLGAGPQLGQDGVLGQVQEQVQGLVKGRAQGWVQGRVHGWETGRMKEWINLSRGS